MPYAHVNGQKLYFEDTDGDRPAIIFSHGLLMDHEMFAPQVAAFRDDWRCITWDERAHGKTAGDTLDPFSYYDSADDLAALIRHLGLKNAVIAGMSQGGYLSLRCALTHPDVVRALVLIDTQAQVEDPAKTAGYKPMMEAWAQHGLPEAVATTIEHIILGPAWPGAEAWKAKWRGWKGVNLMGAYRTLVTRDDLTDRIANIRAPTLVIHGDADMAIELERAEDMARRIPNASLTVIKGAGHASNLTHPLPVNAALMHFLDALDG